MTDIPHCGNCPHFKRWNNAGDAVGCCLSQKPLGEILTSKNTRQFLYAGYTFEQEQQFKKHRRDLTRQQAKHIPVSK